MIFKDFGKKLAKGLIEGGDGVIIIGAVGGTVGLVVSSALVTGIAFTLTSLVMKIAGDNLFIIIMFAFFAAYVLGMGLTVTSAYILCALIVAPVLIKSGVNPLAAHLLLFWFSQISNVSPPVCVAAFVGAGIAKADPYKVGFKSLFYSSFLIILPFLFVFSDILMPEGLTLSAINGMVSGFIAAIAYAAFINGYLYRKIGIMGRLILLVTTIMFLYPNYFSILTLF